MYEPIDNEFVRTSRKSLPGVDMNFMLFLYSFLVAVVGSFVAFKDFRKGTDNRVILDAGSCLSKGFRCRFFHGFWSFSVAVSFAVLSPQTRFGRALPF